MRCVPQHLPEGSGPRPACERHRAMREHQGDAALGASARRPEPFGAQLSSAPALAIRLLFRRCAGSDAREAGPRAQRRAAEPLRAVSPRRRRPAGGGRLPSPRVGAWLDPQTHRVWLWTARRGRVARRPAGTPAAYSVSDSRRPGQSTPKGPTILPNCTNSACALARTGLPPTPQVRGRLGFGLRAEPGGNVREWKALLFQLRPPEGAPSPQTPRPPPGPRPAAEEGKGQLKQDAVADAERGRLLPYPEGLPFRPAASGSVVRLGLGEGSRLDSTGVLSLGSGHHGSVWPPLWSSGNPRSAELGYPTAAVQLAALSAPSSREDRSEPVNTGGARYLGNVVRKPEGMQDRPHRLPPPPQFLERAGQTETSSLLRGDGKWCCRFQCPMANIILMFRHSPRAQVM